MKLPQAFLIIIALLIGLYGYFISTESTNKLNADPYTKPLQDAELIYKKTEDYGFGSSSKCYFTVVKVRGDKYIATCFCNGESLSCGISVN
jgi:hypothetical protein